MRILHIVPGIDQKLGGATYALINILKIEKILDFESEVLTFFTDAKDESLENLATIHRFESSFPTRFSRSRDTNSWLRNNAKNFDVAVIHGVWGFMQVEAAKILHRVQTPFVIWPHGSLDPFDLQKKRYAKRMLGPILVRSMLEQCSAVFCTAQLEAEKLERYGAAPEIRSIPLPVSTLPIKGDRARFRQRFKFSEEDFVFLFLSRIDYKKGLNLLIPAFSKLIRRFPQLKLAIAGSGSTDYEEKVQKWIAEYGVGANVALCGFLSGNDKVDAFAGSDCFVLPSMNENFGIAIVESLSMGLPVLISNNVYIWNEILREGGGWVCEYSTESLSDVISQIIDNPVELQAKKDNAKKAARQFAPNSLAPLYRQLYQSIVTNRKAQCRQPTKS
jgi:glycosyltransferase involved in cell wall biosynthesis